MDQDQELYVRKMCTQIERLNQLVAALLTISKLDSGTLELEHSSVCVYEVLNKALESFEVIMKNNNRYIHMKKDMTVVFVGDFYWSSQAISNIIKNCLEHSAEEGMILITYSQNPIYTQIMVEDNGEGFYQKDIPHVFTRFYKGKNSTKDSVGIGLSLAKSIIEKQNGEIRAENRKTGGARFIIRFYGK